MENDMATTSAFRAEALANYHRSEQEMLELFRRNDAERERRYEAGNKRVYEEL